MSKIIDEYIDERTPQSDWIAVNDHNIQNAAILINMAFESGNKVLLCGNGGSAADSQHIAAEFVGRFMVERQALPAIALTTDTSIITAIGNDYGFEFIFSRQIEAVGNSGDVLIAISTSGNSTNILTAIKAAYSKNMKVVGLTGNNGGRMKDMCGIHINIPSDKTYLIQETHICVGHLICSFIDSVYGE